MEPTDIREGILKEYWLKKMREYETLQLFPASKFNATKIVEKQFEVDEKVIDRIKSLSYDNERAIYTVHLTFLNILFYKYYRVSSLLVRCQSVNIQEETPQPMYVKAHLKDELTISQLIKSQAHEIQETHQHLSNEPSVLRILKDYEDLPHIFFNYGEEIDILKYTCPFNLVITPRTSGTVFKIAYCDEIEGAFINQIIRHYKHVLSYVFDLSTPIGQIDILTKSDKDLLTSLLQEKVKSFPNESSMHRLFESNVKEHPDAIAVAFEDRSITYKELDMRANQLAAQLRRLDNLEPDDIIGIMLTRSEALVISILGVLKAGVAYLPISVNAPKNYKQHIIEDCSLKVIITHSDYLFDLADYQGPLIAFDIEIEQNRVEEAKLDLPENPRNLAYVIYTSGTTGKPKGVLIEHRSNINMAYDQINHFDIRSSDRILQFANSTFDASVFEIFMALYAGASLVIVPEETILNVNKFVEYLFDNKVSIVTLPPTYLSELNKEKLDFLRIIITAGDVARPKDALECIKYARYFNAYGPTECAVCSSVYEVTEKDEYRQSIPIGHAISNTEILIVDEVNNVLPNGVAGMMAIMGAGVTRGYLNRPEITESKIITIPLFPNERIYLTGDMARRNMRNEIEFLGRNDTQVKVRGHRIELGEIESCMRLCDSIKDVVVIANNSLKETQLVAYVIPKEKNEEKIRAYLGHQLPKYMHPSHIVFLDSFPRTAHGKVHFKMLPEPYVEESKEKLIELPRNVQEEQLVEIWSTILGKTNIGITDNFFALGGDSIKAIRLVVEINELFGIDIEVKDVFETETIAKLSEYIDGRPASNLQDELSKSRLYIQSIKEKILSNPEEKEKLPEDWEDFYPVSDIQKGMFFFSSLKPELGIYHDQMYFQFVDETFDFELFQKALLLIMEKHEILRASFHMETFSEALMFIHHAERVTPHISFKDITQENDKKEFLMNCLAEDKSQPFQLNKPGLWRIYVYQIGKVEYGCILVCHHAIIDGWSDASWKTELSNVYFELKVNSDYKLSKLSASYKDFVIDQDRIKKSHTTQDYWKRKLIDYNRTPLPFGRTAEASSLQKSAEGLIIDAELTAKLETLGAKIGVSNKAIYLAAWYYTLGLVTSTMDVVLGVVANARPEIKDGDKILGCFLNSVPLRITIPNSISSSDYIRNVEKELRVLKENDKLPLVNIVELINERQDSKNAFFDILFNYIDFHIYDSLHEETEETTRLIHSFGKTNTLLDIEVKVLEETVSTGLIYLSDVFKSEEVKRILGYLKNTLQAFASEVDHLDVNQIIGQKEVDLLVHGFNPKEIIQNDRETIQGLFLSLAIQHPDNVAYVFEDQCISYKELDRRSNQLSNYLIESRHVKPSDLVGVFLDRSIDMIVGILAVIKAGAAYIPISLDYPEQRIHYILDDARVQVLITNKKTPVIQSLQKFGVIDLSEMKEQVSELPPQLNYSINDPLYVIYTSGSSGNPKGVLLQQAGVINRINWMWEHYKFGSCDVLFQKTPYVFDVSVWEIFAGICFQTKTVLCPSHIILDPNKLLEHIELHKITTIHFVPSMYNVFLKNVNKDLDVCLSLRQVFVSGEELTLQLAKMHYETFSFPLRNLYGPTEASIEVTHYTVTSDASEIPIGKPIDNIQVFILNQNLQLVPIGARGEICLSGIGLASGYINNPNKTKSCFVDHPFFENQKLYRTGDVGSWSEGGNIKYHGRMDDQVKVRGNRVELSEINAVISDHPFVKDSCVLVNPEERDTLVAFVVSSNNYNRDNGFLKHDKLDYGHDIAIHKHGQIDAVGDFLNSLKDHVKSRVPGYMIPSEWILISEIPITINGKVDKKALYKADKSTSLKSSTYRAPSNIIEKELASIWERVLNKDTISVDDNFFELGGHSLKATQLIFLVSKSFDVKLSFSEILEKPTVSLLAEVIRKSKRIFFKEIEVIEEQEYYEMTRQQLRLWLIDQLEEGGTAYNMPDAFEIEGIEPQLLSNAIKELIARHDSLRTRFRMVGKSPKQKVVPNEQVQFELQIEDLRSHPDIKSIARRKKREEALRPFDLANDLLIRAKLLQVDTTSYVFLMTVHHIVADGWSMELILSEIMTFYKAHQMGNPNALPALRLQYKDYSAWQAQELRSEAYNSMKSFWTNMFADNIPVLNFPADKPRPVKKSYSGSSRSILISKKLLESLHELSNTAQVTLFNTLITSVYALLFKYTNQSDIVIGSPVAGREHLDLESQVGLFVNTVVIRSKFDGSDSFKILLEKVKSTSAEVFKNQSYPFDQLVEDLKVDRSSSRLPLFDVVVVLQNTALTNKVGNENIETISVKLHDTEFDISKFDLHFLFFEYERGLTLKINYDSDLFERSTIDWILLNFELILNDLIANPNKTLNELAFIPQLNKSPEVPTRYLDNTDTKGLTVDSKLLFLYDNQVNQMPLNTALIYCDKGMTYQELEILSNRVASFLIHNVGINKNDWCALDIKHDERYVVILLAIFKIGAMYVESSVFSLLSNIKLRFVNNGREENNFDDANIKVINIDQNWSEMTTKLYDDINPKMGFKLKKESLQDGISIRMLNGSSIK